MKYDRKDEYVGFINRLNSYMLEKKITQAELSRITGISQSRISKIKRGQFEFLSNEFWCKLSRIGNDYSYVKYGIR